MSVIVARPGVGGGSSSGGSPNLLYDEKPASIIPPAAQGDNSVALGSGAQTAVSAPGSLAIGEQSLARHQGAVVQRSGRFASRGDIQHGRYLLRTVTLSDIPTEAFINGVGGSLRLTIPDDATWTFTITVTAHRTDSGGGHAGYKFEGVIFRESGALTTSFQGIPVKTVIAESDPAWDINIAADTSTGALTVFATGQPGKTIRWAILVETLEVTN